MKAATTVDAYVAAFPRAVQVALRAVRATIRRTAPGADESIRYGMPAYRLHDRPLVYFAAFVHHVGLYATPTAHAAFAKELARYKVGKGSVQFPLDRPMPLPLIARMVRFKARENAARVTRRAKPTTKARPKARPSAAPKRSPRGRATRR